MTYPRTRSAVAWLACAALLGNFLLPAALSLGPGLLGQGHHSALCSTGSRDTGKTKPGVLVHHCAFCAVPAAQLPARPAGIAVAGEIGRAAHAPFRTAFEIAPFRQGRVQARAPPAAA